MKRRVDAKVSKCRQACDALLPMCSALFANRILDRKIRALDPEPVVHDDPRLKESIEVIREFFDADIKRLDRIESKAQGSVFGAGLAITVLIACIGLLAKGGIPQSTSPVTQAGVALLLFGSMLYFLFSALSALKGYQVDRRYLPDLRDRAELTSNDAYKAHLLHCLDLNRLVVIKKANWVTASLTCARNAIVTLLALFVVLLTLVLARLPGVM